MVAVDATRIQRSQHASGYDSRLDIAKSVFQVHGVDAAGQRLIRRQLKRRYVLAFFEKLRPCLVGIEACHLVAWSIHPPTTTMSRRPGQAVLASVI